MSVVCLALKVARALIAVYRVLVQFASFVITVHYQQQSQ